MPLFSVGDTVYAYHGAVLYKGKVLAVQEASDIVEYRLHYDGWNAKWDEWVASDRVLPVNESTTQLLQQLKKKSKKSKSPSAGAGAGSAPSGKKSKKRKTIDPDAELEDGDSESLLALTLQFPLKKALVEDWERINESRCLVSLPRKITVADILTDFLATKKQRNATDNIFVEVVEGLRLYFDRALGSFLLYRFERLQYEKLLEDHKDKPMSEQYGVEHLLRLFVKLPYFIAQSALQDTDLGVLQPRLNEFLSFVNKNLAKYYTKDYEKASEEYVEAFKEATTK